MGRPIAKKYFGNRNIGTTGTADNGIGGEGVARITLGGTNNSSGYALNDPLIISAPDLPGGVQATAKVATLNTSTGQILTIEVTEKGSGYITAPTVTEDVGGVQGTLTFTAVLTTDSGAVGSATNQENAIIIRAKTTSGGTAKIGDVQKQSGSRRYKIKTSDGVAVCKLVPSTSLSAGEAYLVATSEAGGTYYVTKLTAHRATLVAKTGDDSLDGSSVQWTFASPTGSIVQIENA